MFCIPRSKMPDPPLDFMIIVNMTKKPPEVHSTEGHLELLEIRYKRDYRANSSPHVNGYRSLINIQKRKTTNPKNTLMVIDQ